MKNKMFTILALSACTLAPLSSFAADRTKGGSEDNVATSQAKLANVHMTLKNRSNLTQNLIIQGRPVSLAANEEMAVTLPVGTQVMGADNTVRLTVTKDYNNAVASFR